MFCENCGAHNAEGTAFCSNCGAAMSAPVAAPAESTSQPGKGLAIAAMILGIVSFFCFPAITGALGIIFGACAKGKGSTSGMATAGIVLGAIGIGLWLIMLIACGGAMFSLTGF